MKKVLFVCIHNSARSQIAEALLEKYGEGEFQVASAGFEPGEISPFAVEILKEEGIDISNKSTDHLLDLFKNGKLFNYVVTVCDEATAQKCPIFPGVRARIQWDIKDPRAFIGTDEEKLNKFREVKDTIKEEVLKFIELVNSGELKENFPDNWKLG